MLNNYTLVFDRISPIGKRTVRYEYVSGGEKAETDIEIETETRKTRIAWDAW